MHSYLKPTLVVHLHCTDFFSCEKCVHLSTSCHTDKSLSNINSKKCFLVLLYYRGTFEHDVEYKEDNNEIYVCNGNYVHCTSHTLFKNYAPQNHLKEFIFYTLWTSHLKTIPVSALLYRHNRQITKNKPYDFSPFELLVFWILKMQTSLYHSNNLIFQTTYINVLAEANYKCLKASSLRSIIWQVKFYCLLHSSLLTQ